MDNRILDFRRDRSAYKKITDIEYYTKLLKADVLYLV